jgi:hypothetical protein
VRISARCPAVGTADYLPAFLLRIETVEDRIMTYDPYRDLPRANPPRPSSVDRAAAMGWTFTAIASAVIVAGIALYNTGPVRTPTAANPPAAPGAQAPAPVPDETVGTSAPR